MKKIFSGIKIGKGVLMTLIYAVVSIIFCAIVYVKKDIILSWEICNYFATYIDKTTLLASVEAIAICSVTILTLSLSIEGDSNRTKFGMTPKQLNEFENFPISISSSFITLGVTFTASILLLRSNNGLLFYILTMLTLIYYVMLTLIALPVLQANDNKALKQIASSFNKMSQTNTQPLPEIDTILKYLFSNGKSPKEIYEMLNSKKKINDEVLTKKTMLRSLKNYLSDRDTLFKIKMTQWALLRSSICSLNSPYGKKEYADELFGCLFNLYKEKELKEEIAAMLYEIAIHRFGIGDEENDDREAIIEELFIRMAAYSLHSNDLTFFDVIKKSVSLYEYGTPFSKKGRYYFSLISFLLFSYSVDKKVPEEEKANIKNLLDIERKEPNYDVYSWKNIFENIVINKFDIDRTQFVEIIKAHDIRLEYPLYGKMYTPIISHENALKWYWVFLFASDEEKTLSRCINQNDDFELLLFKQFMNKINNNDLTEEEKIYNFYFENSNFMDAIDDYIQLQEISCALNDLSTKKVYSEIKKENEENGLIYDIEKELKNYLESFNLSKLKIKKRDRVVFCFDYDKTFSLNDNYYFIQTIAKNMLTDWFENSLPLNHTSSLSPLFKTHVDSLIAKKRNIYYNGAFSRYIRQFDFEKIRKKGVLFNCSLLRWPVCVVTHLPSIGNFDVSIKRVKMNDIYLEEQKNKYDDKHGAFAFKDCRLLEKDFIEMIKKVYCRLEITISFSYDFKNTSGILIE